MQKTGRRQAGNVNSGGNHAADRARGAAADEGSSRKRHGGGGTLAHALMGEVKIRAGGGQR